jgi:hypothetical protein
MDGLDRGKKERQERTEKNAALEVSQAAVLAGVTPTDSTASSFSYFDFSSILQIDIYLFPAFACSLTAAQQVQQVRPQRVHNRQGRKFQLRIALRLLTHLFLFLSHCHRLIIPFALCALLSDHCLHGRHPVRNSGQ